MSNHTPGPWTQIGTAVYFPAVKGGFDFYGCPDAEGNAKLCAAAPDLLEACAAACEVLEVLRRGHGIEVGAACYPAINMLREVLEKLRGDE